MAGRTGTMQTDRNNDSISPTRINEIIYSFRESRILLTAFELGVFTAIGDECRSSAEVAGDIGCDERATDRLMNALCALDFLQKESGRFTNTPSARHYLVEGTPDYLAGIMHSVNMWDSWSTLTRAVRQGGAISRPHVNERGEEWLSAFIAAMHTRATGTADEIVASLDLSGVDSVLDVGGGSGAYSMAFVRATDNITATVFDLPNVIPITRTFIEAEGLSERIETVIGDYSTDSLGSGFDLIFLSAIVHSNSPESNRELVRKCADALNPGGQVIVQDFIMEEERTSPPHGAIFALNMLVGTETGDTYTESEIGEWMEEAGLTDIVRQDTDFRSTRIIGRKPSNGF